MQIPSFARRLAEDGVRAVAEVLFPENDLGAPDWQSAQVVPRMMRYIDALPPRQSAQLIGLYAAVELAGPFMTRWPGRLSRQDAARRLGLLQRWKRSPLMIHRLLLDGLKGTCAMIYMSHPDVLAYMGVYKACDAPGDLGIERRPDVFNLST